MTLSPAVIMALFAALTLLLSSATFYAGWVLRVGKGESAAKAVEHLEGRVERTERELADFKAHVAATYASNHTLDQMEKRVVDAINRLGDRMDGLFKPIARD